jgi:putative DNA primase/helicase
MNFQSFAAAHGLLIRDLREDGRIHRCPTESKPRSDNGAYWLDRDRGWVMDWAQSGEVKWWSDEHAKPWTEAEKADAQRRMREASAKRAAAAADAARQATQMIEKAQVVTPRAAQPWRPGRKPVEAIPQHPYLLKKGFPLEPGLILGDELLIPMFSAGAYEVVGVQRIKPDGTKLFLPGMRAKAAIHRFWSRAGEVWLCEGYATGLSVRLALKKLYRPADVVVCFSAGNLAHVASLGIGTHVAADNDASGAGEAAARQTGLPFAMPERDGMDMNDLHLAEGIGAVADLLIKKI